MAKLRFNFRKKLRAIANRAQDENVARLIAGRTVPGGAVAPRKVEPAEIKGRGRRIRIGGERVNLKDLAGVPGIRSGEMIRDAQRRGNIRLGRTSFKIVPSIEVRARWFAFNSGTEKQEARSISGMDALLLQSSREEIAKEGRDQIVKALQRRRKG